MQTKHRKTLDAVFAKPPRHEMRWADIESLFRHLGEVKEAEGSRVLVGIGDASAVFHRPHPRPMVGPKTIRDVRDFLIAAGVAP